MTTTIVSPLDVIIERPHIEGNLWTVRRVSPKLGVKGAYTPANARFFEFIQNVPNRAEAERLAEALTKNPAGGTVYITTKHGNLVPLEGPKAASGAGL
jgi:hypothetical protein